jgi:hypothetical protein
MVNNFVQQCCSTLLQGKSCPHHALHLNAAAKCCMIKPFMLLSATTQLTSYAAVSAKPQSQHQLAHLAGHTLVSHVWQNHQTLAQLLVGKANQQHGDSLPC